MQYEAHRIEPRALLAIGAHDSPWRVGRVGVREHRLLGLRVLIPFVQRREIDGAELPLLERMHLAFLETPYLLLAAHRKPELHDVDAALREMPLERRHLLHEVCVFVRRAETHHPLDARTVVPGAVEQDALARCRQMLYVALEISLSALLF